MRSILIVAATVLGLSLLSVPAQKPASANKTAPECKCENCCDCDAELDSLREEMAKLKTWAKATEGYLNEHVAKSKPKSTPVQVQTVRSGHWETRCNGRTCQRVWVTD